MEKMRFATTFTRWEGSARKDGSGISSWSFPFDDLRTWPWAPLDVIVYWIVMKNKSSEWLDYIELGFDSINLKCVIHMKTVYQDENNLVLVENSVEWKPCITKLWDSSSYILYLYMVFIQHCFQLDQDYFHLDRQFSCVSHVSNWLSRIPTHSSLVIQNSCSS